MSVIAVVGRIKAPLYKNAVYLMSNAAAMGVSGFFAWVIAARFYSAASIGLATATVAAISLLAVISNFGFGAAIIRYLEKVDSQRELVNTCLTVSGAIAVVLAIIYIAGTRIWSRELDFLQSPSMALIFTGCTVLWSLTWLLDSVFVAYRRADKVFWKNNIFSIAKLTLPLLFIAVAYGQGIVLGWGLGLLVGVVVSFGLWLPQLANNYRSTLPRVEVLKQTWRYSLGSYLVLLLKTNPGMLLPLLVVNTLGAEANAYFYMSWTISALLFSIPTAVSDSLFAEGSHAEGKLRQNTGRAIRFVMLLVIPASVGVIMLGEWVLSLFGESYTSGYPVLRLLAVSGVFVAMTAIYESVLRVKGKLRELNIITGCITIMMLVGGTVGLRLYGLDGIGYCWLLAHMSTGSYATYRILKKENER